MVQRANVALPTQTLLRELTDRHVVEQLLDAPALTRSEIAARTGISKPTISESVRRLSETGVLAEAGAQAARRGPAGTLYALGPGIGSAIAVSAGPDGVAVEVLDVRGRLVRRTQEPVEAPVRGADLGLVLRRSVQAAVDAAAGPMLAGTLSVAGPVDQPTGRLVHLTYSPFLTDELAPRDLLADLVPGLRVDNDVNWAALAEHHHGKATDLTEFCYCYLGPGVGAAVVSRGSVVHGHRGLAGEIANILTTAPGGRSRRLIDCFAALGLVRAGSAVIDVERAYTVLAGRTAADRRTRTAIATALAGALSSVAALLNPEGVLIGGPWGRTAGFAELVAERVRETSAVATEVRPAGLGTDAPLVGARIEAVRAAQRALTGGV